MLDIANGLGVDACHLQQVGQLVEFFLRHLALIDDDSIKPNRHPLIRLAEAGHDVTDKDEGAGRRDSSENL